jgi:hypothetical protein
MPVVAEFNGCLGWTSAEDQLRAPADLPEWSAGTGPLTAAGCPDCCELVERQLIRGADLAGDTRDVHLLSISPIAVLTIGYSLYAALAEVLTTSSTLLDTLSPSNTEPDAVAARPRAYFASVALSILYVCLSQVDPVSRTVRVVGFGPDHPTAVTEDACPPHLRGIVTALVSIAIAARELRDEDDRGAVERAVEDEYAGRAGQDEETKVEMLKRNLETGSGPDSELSNVIQALVRALRAPDPRSMRLDGAQALRVTHMPQFADKQSEVFEILCGLRPASPATAKATW